MFTRFEGKSENLTIFFHLSKVKRYEAGLRSLTRPTHSALFCTDMAEDVLDLVGTEELIVHVSSVVGVHVES